MKKIFGFFVCLISLNAYCEVVTKEGYINQLIVNAESQSTPGTWFTVDTLASAGDCKVSGVTGGVILYIDNTEQGKRQYSMALASIASQLKVLVRVDSTDKHPELSDRCMLRYIAIQR